MIIDIHAHLWPRRWESGSAMRGGEVFDPAGMLEARRAAGIDVTIFSNPHMWTGDPMDMGDIEHARTYNEFAAEVQRAHPGELFGLASITPWRGAEHLEELERAVVELGLTGVCIPTSYRGAYLDTVPDEFWELAVGLGVSVLVHPVGPPAGFESLDIYRLSLLLGAPLATTVSFARAVLTGALDRNPDLRLIACHAGGALCALAGRLDFGHELRGNRAFGSWGEVELPLPPSAYIRRLFVDTVTYGPEGVRLALDTLGEDHLLFGTDRPPVGFPFERTLAGVYDAGLTGGTLDAVLSGNAARLFPMAAIAIADR